MPLIYQHNINDTARLGVWHIGETEAFFLRRVPLKRDVSHPHKRLQHLAGRWLLRALYDDFPLEEILVADTRKPFLEKERYHFSISHCGDYAAAMVSPVSRVGVDIELVGPKVERVKHKFLSEEEWGLVSRESGTWSRDAGGENGEKPIAVEDYHLLTLLWSAKEAVYKWFGEGGVDFKDNIRLTGHISRESNRVTMPFLFAGRSRQELTVHARVSEKLVLAWVTGKSQPLV